MKHMQITVLVENTAAGQSLLAEHGLACSILIDGRHMLMDCGQGLVGAHNAQRMNMPLDDVAAVVLSHGHYDHTGGLAPILLQNPQATLYAHPDCVRSRYIRTNNGSREVGMPPAVRLAVLRHDANWVKTRAPTSILPGLRATGTIPRVTDFEDTGGPFFLDEACQQPDSLSDDQALFFEGRHGTVVLLGCAHAGVINTLLYIRHLTDGRPIHAVMGGMHLVGASQERLGRTIEQLREMGVERFAPAHCTGSVAVAALRAAFPSQCLDFCVGTRLEFAPRDS